MFERSSFTGYLMRGLIGFLTGFLEIERVTMQVPRVYGRVRFLEVLGRFL